MINKTIVRKTILKKISINETIINKATTTNKAKNDVNIYNEYVDSKMQCDKYIKKVENILIQEFNPLSTLNLALKLNLH